MMLVVGGHCPSYWGKLGCSFFLLLDESQTTSAATFNFYPRPDHCRGATARGVGNHHVIIIIVIKLEGREKQTAVTTRWRIPPSSHVHLRLRNLKTAELFFKND